MLTFRFKCSSTSTNLSVKFIGTILVLSSHSGAVTVFSLPDSLDSEAVKVDSDAVKVPDSDTVFVLSELKVSECSILQNELS